MAVPHPIKYQDHLQTKIFHGSKKVLLQYCGRQHSDVSTESHSTSFNSEHEHSDSKDHFDTAHGFRMIDDGGMFSSYMKHYCLLCFEKEKERNPAILPYEDGPWKTHTMRDESGAAMCPLLYFSTCVCGTTGYKAHLRNDCPIILALGHY